MENITLWVPILLILYNMTANLANDIYLPSMPLLVDVFSTSANLIQLTMTAWYLGVAIPQLFFGPLSEAIGRRPVLLGGGVIFIIATLMCGSSIHVWQLFLGRFLQGVGVCSLNVTSFSIISDLYAYRSRIHWLAYLSMSGSLAPLVGPILGGYILCYFGWRANFILIFFLLVACLVALWFKLPESNYHKNPAALQLLIMAENYLLSVKNLRFVRYAMAYCCMLGGFIAYLTGSPFIVIYHFHILPEHFGFTLIGIFGFYMIGSLFVIYGGKWIRLRNVVYIGLSLIVVSCVLMLITSYFLSQSLYSFVVPMMFYAFGYSLCSSQFINKIMSSSIHRGTVAALLGFGMASSSAVSSTMVSVFYNNSMLSISGIIAFMGLCGVVSFLFIKRKTQRYQYKQRKKFP